MEKRLSKAKIRQDLQVPSLKRNTDTLKLLLSHPDFKKILSETRALLNIPGSGLKGDAEIEEWTEDFISKSSRLLESKKYRDQALKIKEKFLSGEISLKIANKQLGLLDKQIPVNYLRDTSKFITQRFNLPEHFQESIRHYIVTNQMRVPLYNFSLSGNPQNKRHLSLNIYSKLGREDLLALKNLIDLVGKKLPPADHRSISEIDTKLKIEEWYANREYIDSVTGEPYQRTAKDVAEELFGDPNKDSLIYDTVKELRRTRKRRFKSLGD